MGIKTKYDVGQSVYIVNKHTKILEKSESCDLCFGMEKLNTDHTACNVRSAMEKEN